ncbi:MAG: helix-turn-helix domain-containing protein [Actinomycetota bacterium]|nr:helix-turn-helix domain-containing protein [Actinomycetota bacterium]
MFADRNSELVRRAAVHSALGDPARLSIVDVLAIGDAAPSELRTRLGMPSNLLAHHLAVLERAGIIRRTRSQADRRRTYLRLVPAALDGVALATAALSAPPRVMFVCTENSARSQLAAALWTLHSDIPVVSAGTHPAPRVHPGAHAAARRHHLPMEAATPRRLIDHLHADDFVITVCDAAHEELRPVLPWAHWSVADPAPAGTHSAFDQTVDDLIDRITRLAPVLTITESPRP